MCQDDEACCASAVKEGANAGASFVWVQLRGLGAFLEQRSWHRSPALCLSFAFLLPFFCLVNFFSSTLLTPPTFASILRWC